MNLAGPFMLGVLMFSDRFLLARQNSELARTLLRGPTLYAVVWAVVAGLYALLIGETSGAESLYYGVPVETSAIMALFFYFFIFPIYMLQRRIFKRTDPDRPSGYLNGDDRATRIYLGMEFFQTCMVGFFGSVVIEVVLATVIRLMDWKLAEIDELMISIVFSTILVLAIIRHSARKFSPGGFWANLGFAKGITWSRGVLVPILIGVLFAGVGSITVMRNAGRQPQTPMSETLQTAETPAVIILFIAWAWLVAPIFEEIIFRGYYFHIFRKSLGRVMAVALIALTFAVLHVPQYWGDWGAIAVVSATGLGLTLMRDWSGTTRASLIMHLVYNVGVTLIPAAMLTAQNPYYHEYQARYEALSVTEKEDLLLQNIEHNAEFSDAYNDLAWLYAEEQIKIDEGLRLINLALDMTPDSSAYKDTKAELLEVKGDYDEALTIRQDIIETSYSDDMIDRQRDRMEEIHSFLGSGSDP